MKKNQLILGVIVLAALIGLGMYGQHKHPFDFHAFGEQFQRADWRLVGVGMLCIFLGYLLRAVRWALLIRHNKKVGLFSLVGTQVIGFTAVALIGRVADLVRPYLVSRQTLLPLGSQIAVYIVERLFDAGSMGLIFSVAMLWVPQDEILRATSHSKMMSELAMHSPALTASIARFGGLALTLIGALFLVAIRLGGETIAGFFEGAFGLFSKKLGAAIGDKVRAFRTGLDTIRTLPEFAATASISILMWMLIAFSYFEVCRAFTASYQLATITAPKCVLLMIASGSASIIQLPVIGWFTQIGLVAAAIVGIVGSTTEASFGCAAMLLLVTFLEVVPVGLIWAWAGKISLRKVAEESEHAGEGVTAQVVEGSS